MLNISFNLSHVKYAMFSLVRIAKDIEDWFGCGKLYVFFSYECLVEFLILNINSRQLITTTSVISNIKYFTHDK